VAPKNASHCTNCGGTRLTGPALQRFPFPLPTTVLGRVVLVVALLLASWLLVIVVKWLATVVLVLVCRLLVIIVALWLLTGILPSPWGARVRSASWALVKFAVRFVAALFER
jgi:hypothetical protein